jgi:hypothetical protein
MRIAKLLPLLCLLACEETGEYIVEYTSFRPAASAVPSRPEPVAVPVYGRQPPRTSENAERFNLETKTRCTADWSNQKVVQSEPFAGDSFRFERVDKGDPLPDLDVRDLKFEDKTVPEVMDILLANTGMRVRSDGLFGKRLTVNGVSGKLARVMDMVSSLGGVYYSYDSRTRMIRLARYAKWSVSVPLANEVVLAVEDALRGAGIDNLVIDWADRALMFGGDATIEERARAVVAKLSLENYLIAYDVNILRAVPTGAGGIAWQELAEALNMDTIKLSKRGVIGRALVLGSNFGASALAGFLYPRAGTRLISEGTFVMPERWQGRFDIGRCSRETEYETDLSILAETRYRPDKAMVGRLDSTIVLRTSGGDMASFDLPSRLGDNILLIGIPTQYFARAGSVTDIPPNAELVVLLSPRIIKIVKPDGAAK